MESAESGPTQAEPTRPPKKKSRKKLLRWIGGGAVVLLVLVYFIVPPIAASYVHGLVIALLDESSGGKTTIADLSISWSGGVTAREIGIVEGDGRPALRCARIDADISVWRALGGHYAIDGTVEGLHLYVSRGADGKSALAVLRNIVSGDGSAEVDDSGTEQRADATEEPSSALALTLQLDDARLILLEASEQNFVAIDGSWGMTRDRPMAFDIAFSGLGDGASEKPNAPGGIGGSGKVSGEIGGASPPRMEFRHDIPQLDLEQWPPMILELLGLTELRGVITGAGSVTLDPGSVSALGLTGTGELRIDGLHVAGPAVGEHPLSFQRLRAAFVDGSGIPEKSEIGTFEVDDFLTLKLFNASEKAGAEAAIVELNAQLEGASKALGDVLGVDLRGALAATAQLEGQETRLVTTRVSVTGFQLPAAEESETLPPMDIALDTVGTLDTSGAGRFDWKSGTVKAPGLELALKGFVAELFSAPSFAIDLAGDIEPNTIVGKLRPLLGAASIDGDAGKLSIAFRSSPDSPSISATIETPRLAWIDGDDRIAQRDVRCTVTLPRIPEADIAGPPDSFHFQVPTLRTSALEASLVGWLQGERGRLRGTVDYVPDELSALVKPYLGEFFESYRLTGTDKKRIELDVETTSLAATDLFAIARALSGTAKVGVGDVVGEELRAQGDVVLHFDDEHLRTTGEIALNGGTVTIDGDLHLSEASDASSTVKITGEGVKLTAEVAELLRMVHPIFAVTEGTVDGLIDGAISGNGSAEHRGPISMELLMAGWKALPKEPIYGRGHLEVTKFTVKGTPLLDEILSVLDQPQPKEIELNELDFTVDRGRVRYDRPMRMKVDARDTTWTGTLGLDESLDLIWEIPLDDAMTKRYPALSYLGQESVRVPVGGTSSRPRVAWQKVIADAASRAVQGGAEKAIDDLLGKEAGVILAEADRLWNEGRLGKARKLYRELQDKHDKSLVYLLNKKRIRERLQP